MHKIDIKLKTEHYICTPNPKLKFIFVIRFWPTAFHITAIVT